MTEQASGATLGGPGRPPRVYLAGPDVFLRDAVAQGARKKALCKQYGLEGVFPFDVEVQAGDGSRRDTGYRISEVNEGLIRSCAAMIANMTPFRGASADVGTAYEMGFGRALGLLVCSRTAIAEQGFTRQAVRDPATGAPPRPQGCGATPATGLSKSGTWRTT